MYKKVPVLTVAACLAIVLASTLPANAQTMTPPKAAYPVTVTATPTLAPPEPLGSVVVKVTTPVVKSPEPNATPVRVAKEGSIVTALEAVGDWYHIEYNDPQRGRSTGYIRKGDVTLVTSDPSQMQPMHLTAATAAASSLPSAAPSRLDRAPDTGRASDTVSARPKHVREGIWFNAGLGAGSAGCENCFDRVNGLSGGLSLGGRLSPRVLLGVGSSGFSRDGLSIGTLDARFRFYPSLNSGFFVTTGIGVGSITDRFGSDFGLGVLLGIGADFRVAPNVSLTPFWNGFAMQSSSYDVNVGQIGLGVTIH